MRIAFAIIFSLMIGALGFCAFKARRTKKPQGRNVAQLLVSLIPPVMGNLIIIVSTNKIVSIIGCYIYYLGMDQAMFALIRFAIAYCEIPKERAKYFAIAYVFLIIDVFQLLVNPFLGHAFDVEVVLIEDADYYKMIPLLGQAFHRFVDYSILAAVLVTFIVKSVNSPRVSSEKYTVIFMTIIVTAVWQTFYIFSRTPVDRSMIGFGAFGLMVFYFSLYYKPRRLLDRMLAEIASKMPDALFFFDSSNHCIWANEEAKKLSGIKGEDFDCVNERLKEIFGVLDWRKDGHSTQYTLGDGDEQRSYIAERHAVKDTRGKVAGSFLSVRDNTDEHRVLQREIWNATHDSLTGVYNRAGYDLLLSGIDLWKSFVLLVDADDFKHVNDNYGHEAGDKMLKKMANALSNTFGCGSFVCRMGGDEFVVIIPDSDVDKAEEIGAKIDEVNAALGDTSDGLPAMSVSVGVAHGGNKPIEAKELMGWADKALYNTKRTGKHGFTFYRKTVNLAAGD